MLKRVLNWAGCGLALAGIAFLTWRLHGYWASLDFALFTPSVWAWMALLVIVYGSANLLLAMAWWFLLTPSRVGVTRWWAVRTYGISQLGKYLPGNIFHLAGRQAIGMGAGVPGGFLAKSTLWELGLIANAGLMYGLLIIPLLFPLFPRILSAALFLGVTVVVVFILQKSVNAWAAKAFFLQLIFLAFSGAIFVALYGILVRTSTPGLEVSLSLGAAYIIAWLAGLVTPGAPAGVGVRELVLLILAKGIVAEADLLLMVLMARIISVLGDLFFFLFSITTLALSRGRVALTHKQ